ncbi:hypothetical protein FPHOBKDP_00216 [Listeria phage LPJP1]|nr:hypothetical protein FPHOBKDP_00216 [Listeria phage LPJP1]
MVQLSDSAIFNTSNFQHDLKIKLNKINTSKDVLSKDVLDQNINIINRRINYPTKNKVVGLYNSGKIIPISNKSNKFPSYLIVFERRYNNQRDVLVDVSRYTNAGGEIQPKTLFGLMQQAMITYELNGNWNRFTSNTELMKNSSIAYSRLGSKIFDKMFSLNLNDFKSDFVSFILSKFYLLAMAKKNYNNTIDDIAYKACFNGSSLSLIKEMEEGFNLSEKELYKDIFTLFDNLKKIKGLEKLQVRSYLENYVRMYGDSTVLAIDYLPAFMHMVMSSSISANLNREAIIENTLGKFSLKTFTSFSSLI